MKVNNSGVAYAKRLVASDDVDLASPWSFTSADGNKLLGPDGNDWTNFASFHLAIDANVPEETKAHYKYPYGKDNKVYRRGVIAAKARAAQQGDTAISEAADSILQAIDEKYAEDVAELCPECGKKLHEGSCDECGYKRKKRKGIDSLDSARVQRFDLFMDSTEWMTKPFERTTEGFLRGRPIVTSIGVFQYANPDGTTHGELRLPEEVFAEDSLESLKMKPVTNEHPHTMVDPMNCKTLAVGNLGSNPSWQDQLDGWPSPTRVEMTDGKHVAIDMLITENETISDVLKGKRALSCGYTCDLESKKGVYLGMAYDFVQRGIRYNHLAIVDKARAGDAAMIRMDHADTAYHIDKGREAIEEEPMKVVKIDGVEYQAEAKVIESLTLAESKVATLDAEIQKLKAERDTTQARLAQMEEEAAKRNDADVVRSAVRARLAIEKVAYDAGVEIKDNDTDDALRRRVIAKVFPKLALDGKDEVYVQAAFDSAITMMHDDANAAQRAAFVSSDASNQEEKCDSALARKRMIESYSKGA